MAFTRIQHSGNAVETTIVGNLTDSTATITIAASTGWPDGATAPFYAVINPGGATEEKVKVTTRTGTTLSTVSRGVDGTTAAAHSSGETIIHVFTAVEADEANVAAVQTVGKVTAAGQLLYGTAANAMAALDITADRFLKGGASAPSWATIAINDLSDVSGTPTTGDFLSYTGAGYEPVGFPFTGVRVKKSGTQAVATATSNVAVTFDTETFDTSTFHDTVTNNDRFTYASGPTSYFQVNAVIQVTSSGASSGQFILALEKNGSSYASALEDYGATVTLVISTVVSLAATDYVGLDFSNTSNVTATIGTGSHFEMFRIGE